MKLTPLKIAGLLTAATGAATQIAPLLPPEYRAPVLGALPFLALVAGLLAPQPHKQALPNLRKSPLPPTPPSGAGT